MNLKKKITQNSDIRINHSEVDTVEVVSEQLISWLPNTPREYVVIFIGTDRSTGDALGPLAGTYFKDMRPRHMTVYGTLHHPVHATNLKNSINEIYEYHHNPYVIAVDACLGKLHSVGYLICGRGSLYPGAALKKPLPSIGDMHITGVVNISGFMEYATLQNTRLSLVTDMALQIANILHAIDEKLTYNRTSPAVLLQPSKS